jgi:hypothetical protein
VFRLAAREHTSIPPLGCLQSKWCDVISVVTEFMVGGRVSTIQVVCDVIQVVCDVIQVVYDVIREIRNA